MNEDLLKIHSYVFDILKFAEAKNLALLLLCTGAIGFIGKSWEYLFSHSALVKSIVVISVITIVGCILLLLISLTTPFNAKIRTDLSNESVTDVLSIPELSKGNPISLLKSLFGEHSELVNCHINQSLAAKIKINARSAELKIFIFEKCVFGCVFWVMFLSGSLWLQATN